MVKKAAPARSRAPRKPPPPPAPTLEERRKKMASDLFDDLERLRGQLFAPCIEMKPMVVSGGKDSPASIEIAEVELDEPTFASKRLIVASIAQGIDKVLQLAGLEAGADEEDWTAPVGTTSIRDAARRKQGDVRAASR